MLRLASVVVLSSLALAGCATAPHKGSIAGGECQIVKTPEYQVRGKTAYDQRWADEVTERLVAGCGQPRPHVRPASFDKPPPVVKLPVAKPKVNKAAKLVKPIVVSPQQPAAPPKKRFFERLRDRFRGQ